MSAALQDWWSTIDPAQRLFSDADDQISGGNRLAALNRLAVRRLTGIAAISENQSFGGDADRSSLTRIRDRLPLSVHEEVFQYILLVIETHGLLKAQTVGVDSIFLEANAAMKKIIRKDTGEDWKAYLKRLMREEGLLQDGDDDPTDAELRRFGKQRAKQGIKKVSNDEWVSGTDSSSRIVKMKDGRTHQGYKAAHVVDLESEVILSATVYSGTEGDTEALLASVMTAQTRLDPCGCPLEIEEVAADKGYHSNETLANSVDLDLRTYIPEPNSRYSRRWIDKPSAYQQAVVNNRRRMRRAKESNCNVSGARRWSAVSPTCVKQVAPAGRG